MPAKSRPDFGAEYGACVNPYTEALVVLQVFQEPDGYPQQRLEEDLDDLDPKWVAESLASLDEAGVISVRQKTVYRGDQLARLTALDLVAI